MKTTQTLLLVDDDDINRKLMKKILWDEYDFMEASNGAEAFTVLETHPEISGIIIDVIMPVMGGLEFLTKLANTPYEKIPVIVMTSDIDTEQKALELGAMDFITKPLNPTILKKRLHNVIIRNRESLLQHLENIARFDALTGLYNRRELFSKTERMIKAYPDTEFAFIRFDVDRFRIYNSAMGEAEGNRLLCYIADSLRKASETLPICTYGRVDADIFCICEPNNPEIIEEQLAVSNKRLLEYRSDYLVEGSFGIYIIGSTDEHIETVFTRASMASDKCKHLYGDYMAYYDDQMTKQLMQQQIITNEMQMALAEKQFQPYLQPKYDIKTNLPCGAEALVRWIHPEKGMISPGAFIPVFEKNGFIAKLDYFMWESVCQLLHKWTVEKRNVIPVSVNISRISMYNPEVVSLLTGLIKKYDIPSHLLHLEVTESAYMSNPHLMKETIEELRSAGFTILMDDFGSGYSSLNTLKDINVDILKIDMKFLPTESDDKSKSEKILSSIIRMAGWLGMPVIAEGVETLDQKEFLESMGCGYVQGYFYAKPMPVSEYEKLMVLAKPLFQAEQSRHWHENDADVIWSSSPQVKSLLSGIATPMVIMEYSNSHIDFIRVNTAFQEHLGKLSHNDFVKLLSPEDKAHVITAINGAIRTKETTSCVITYINPAGKLAYYQVSIHLISQIPMSDLLCCMLVDVTKEQAFEKRFANLTNSIHPEDYRQKMLVIDDMQMSRDILSDIFHNTFDVISFASGKEGLEYFKQNIEDISIILLDVIMPGMDGKAFLEQKNILDHEQNIPVIVVSSEQNVNVQLNMLRLGVNDYITKPFDYDIITQRVKNVLDYHTRFRHLIEEYKSLQQ